MRARKEVGIRRRRDGWRVFAKVNGKVRVCPQFPLATPLGELREARDKLIKQHGGTQVEAGSFAADVATYLTTPEVAAMPSIDERTKHLELWLDVLGRDRRRASIERDEIEAVLQGWLKTLSPVTVYHRRTALGRLFVVLDGVDAPNPVKATTRPDHYRPTDKSVPYATVVAILEAMPTERFIKKGIRRPSLARLVAVTMAATGIPPAELVKLQRRRDFEPDQQYVRMPWRNKGAGTPAHRRELLSPGVVALGDLFAFFADGRIDFVEEAVARSFKRAAKRVCGPDTPITLYWLRHTFGTDLYRLTGDLETVRRLLGHVEGSIVTARYAMGAHADVDRAALAALETARAEVLTGQKPAHRLPTELPTSRKRQRKKRLTVAV